MATIDPGVEEDYADYIICNRLRVKNQATMPSQSGAPAIQESGSLYYDESTEMMNTSNGSEWTPIIKPMRTIHLATGKGDTVSLNTAVAMLNALVPPPSQSNPAQIMTDSGSYIYTNPITLPDHGHLNTPSDLPNSQVRFIGTNPLADGIIMSNNSSADGFNLSGVANGIVSASDNSIFRLANVVFDDVDTGINIPHDNVQIFVSACQFLPKTKTLPISIDSTGTGNIIYVNDSIFRSIPASIISRGVRVSNTSHSFCTACVFEGCITAVEALSGTNITLGSCHTFNCPTAVRIGENSAGHLIATALLSTNPAHVMVSLDHATAVIDGNGNRFSYDNINKLSGSTFSCSYDSNHPGNAGLNVRGKLIVGDVENPTESIFGSGAKYIKYIHGFHGTATSSIDDGIISTDISDEIKSFDGSTVNIFPSTAVNATLYVGSEIESFPALWFNTVTGITPVGGYPAGLTSPNVFGTPNITVEYWNGSTWANPVIFASEADPDYYPKSIRLFEVGNHNYRLYYPGTHTKRVLNSVDAFWIRFRITSALTTNGVIEQIKVHANSKVITQTGFTELFGKAELRRELPYDLSFTWRYNGAVAVSYVYLTDEYGVGFYGNTLLPGATATRHGGTLTLPPYTDTSRPLEIAIRYAVDNPGLGGDIIVTVAVSALSDYIDGGATSGEIDFSVLSAPSGQPPSLLDEIVRTVNVPSTDEGRIKTEIFHLDISKLLLRRNGGSGDMVVFNIFRNPILAGDTCLGAFVMLDIKPFYFTWASGTPF